MRRTGQKGDCASGPWATEEVVDGLQPASARGLVRAAEQWSDASCLTDLRIPAGGERGLQGGACGGIRAWAAVQGCQITYSKVSIRLLVLKISYPKRKLF